MPYFKDRERIEINEQSLCFAMFCCDLTQVILLMFLRVASLRFPQSYFSNPEGYG